MKELDLHALVSAAPQALDYVLPGFVRGTVGALISPGGVGKSYWSMALALAIAGGAQADLTGLSPAEGKVLMLTAEDPTQVLALRLQAMCEALGLSAARQAQVFERLKLYNLFEEGPLDVLDTAAHKQLIAAAAGARLVILDTLSRFHCRDENDAKEMKVVMAALEAIAHKSGAAVLYLHHASKAAVLNGVASTAQASRGSSVLTDNARWAAFLASMTEGEARRHGISSEEAPSYVRWNISKQNYGAAAPDRWYRRNAQGVLMPCVLPVRAGTAALPADAMPREDLVSYRKACSAQVPGRRAIRLNDTPPVSSARNAFEGNW